MKPNWPAPGIVGAKDQSCPYTDSVTTNMDVSDTMKGVRLTPSSRCSDEALLPETHHKTAPLSFAQERLWFIDQLDGGSFAYNRPTNIRISGPLDVQALTKALRELVNRHESLRTRFPVLEGVPRQQILAAPDVGFDQIDPSCQCTVNASEADQQAREEATCPFDLSAAPPVRFRLIRLGPEDHRLLFTVHHIVFDGWSQGIFHRELALLYDAFCRGEPSPLAPLRLHYTDAANRQNELRRDAGLDTHLAYWHSQLSGPLPVLDLPPDFVAPQTVSDHGARVPIVVPQPLVAALRELGHQQNVTLFMSLLAAFQALLFRYTQQEDLVVGAPMAGRTQPGAEQLIGLFINTLPLRVDLSGNPRFSELLHRVRTAAIGAYSHQDVPLQMIVEQSGSARHGGQMPLFNTMLNLQPAPEPVTAADVTFAHEDVDTGTTKCDLSLDLKYTDTDLAGEIEYRTHLFDASTMRRMAAQYLQLLRAAVSRPDTRISGLPLMDDAERQKLLVQWNDTDHDYPTGQCAHQLLEQRASENPELTAVVMDDASLTYAELDARANQLAHFILRQTEGKQAANIAIRAERSLEMIVGILGILKAGAAYIPIAADTPDQRVLRILDETDSVLVTTHTRLSDGLSRPRRQHVCLQRDRDAIARHETTPPDVNRQSRDLAYIMYTSGSAGRPKGVMVEHRSVVNYAKAVVEVLGARAADRVLQFATLAFDASVEEIFGALAAGATLVLRTEDAIASAERFVEFLTARKVTFVSLPTAYWHELVTQMKQQRLALPKSVRVMIIGGEKAKAQTLETWHHVASANVRLLNTYGPTETTVVSAVHDLTSWRSRSAQTRELPIGKPIPNTRFYVLDLEGKPVPTGVPGELCISGAGLARGYWQNPELTAERFVECPFSDDPEARMYRTGDRVRWLDSGELEFLGRLDGQIKLRGFRVEPEEIANQLEGHPDIRQCAVVPQASATDDLQLVAYIVSQDQSVVSPAELRTFLGKSLPAFMIPAAFVMLDNLPLTANGKVDRRALSLLQPAVAVPDEIAIQPRTEDEQVLAEIWQEVLGLASVGVHDSFFDLGGHSLKVMQVVVRIKDRFKVDATLRALFEAPTIAELAKQIKEQELESTESKVPSMLEISQARRRAKRSA